ncbi:MAG: hypothetical protein IIA03_11380, partial [Proteobacteria bacterium]|nr:hypothetical protein [Pseudomonadota bacterium]
MDFEYSPKTKDLQERLLKFMDEHIYPGEKDYAAEQLASAVGADTLVLVTGVEQVQLDFGTPRQRPLGARRCREAGRRV